MASADKSGGIGNLIVRIYAKELRIEHRDLLLRRCIEGMELRLSSFGRNCKRNISGDSYRKELDFEIALIHEIGYAPYLLRTSEFIWNLGTPGVWRHHIYF